MCPFKQNLHIHYTFIRETNQLILFIHDLVFLIPRVFVYFYSLWNKLSANLLNGVMIYE